MISSSPTQYSQPSTRTPRRQNKRRAEDKNSKNTMGYAAKPKSSSSQCDATTPTSPTQLCGYVRAPIPPETISQSRGSYDPGKSDKSRIKQPTNTESRMINESTRDRSESGGFVSSTAACC